jgi:ABC-type phosphate transport system substrate-binding protein
MRSRFRRFPVAVSIAGLILTVFNPLVRVHAQTPIRSDLFVVVVHTDNPLEAIDREVLSNVFLKRVVKWPSGARLDPIDLPLNAKAREAFTRAVLHKSISAIRTYWQQQIFSGREVPPQEKASDADVLELVKAARTAVGYVSASASIPAGVRVLSIREKP